MQYGSNRGHVLVAVGLITAMVCESAHAQIHTSDFNGDGADDLVIGVPIEGLSNKAAAGEVNVIYGLPGTGLDAINNRVINQDSPNAPGTTAANDQYGRAIAVGDVNGDGTDDLIVGTPFDKVGTKGKAGSIVLLIGKPGFGLDVGFLEITRDTPGVEGDAKYNQNFGSALACGDFNGDGYADVAVGVPRQGGSKGAVQIFYGSPTVGLRSDNDVIITQDSPGMDGVADAYDYFGSSLTSGDYNGDGFADLAVGVPYDFAPTQDVSPGSLQIIYGSDSGLDTNHSEHWFASVWVDDFCGSNENGFPSSLTSGDFNGDGLDDIGIGFAYKSEYGFQDIKCNEAQEGAIYTLMGGANGMYFGTRLYQDSLGETPEGGDDFGWAVAAGDFNDDGFCDLAAGSPREGVGPLTESGIAHIILGSAGGLTTAGSQIWSQDSANIADSAEDGDQFGSALFAGDFNGDGRMDLVIGVPNEDLARNGTPIADAGAVHVLYGRAGGFGTSANQFWHQDRPNIIDSCEPGDQFGATLPQH